MRTLGQIAAAAKKKNVSFEITERQGRMYGGYDICLASAFAAERMFAERLAFRCSNSHLCDWTF